MTGTGNDIVALTAIDAARTRQPNFYSRIISPAEQEFYILSLKDQLPFEHFVWLLWSVKESAYKFLKRFEPQLIFSPSKMIINGLEPCGEYFSGTVRSGNYLLYSRSFISEACIFSIVNDNDAFSDMHYEIKKISSSNPVDQSKAVRALLVEKFEEIFPHNHLQITKSQHGWPVIIRDREELPIPVSFTHHGHFVAYTFQLSHTLWKTHHAGAL